MYKTVVVMVDLFVLYYVGVTRHALPAAQSPPPDQPECQLRSAPHRLPSILENTHAAFPVVEVQPGEEPLPRG